MRNLKISLKDNSYNIFIEEGIINNASNYIKQIPYKEPCEQKLNEISDLVKEALLLARNHNLNELSSIHKKINSYFTEIYAA